MAAIKGTTKQDFPEVKGKIVESVEINVEASFYSIAIFLQDRTSLTFSIEPCVFTFPIYSQWTPEGEENVVKEYEPIRSKVEGLEAGKMQITTETHLKT